MTVDEMLAATRGRLDRIKPRECAAAMGGALLVDIRPQAQRRLEGEVPGAVLIERYVLEWRLDPASPDRIPRGRRARSPEGPGNRRSDCRSGTRHEPCVHAGCGMLHEGPKAR